MQTTGEQIDFVFQLQARIRAKGGDPIRMEIWDDAVTYANTLLGQLEKLD